MNDHERIAKALEDNLPTDKWRFFYDYARKSLDEDIARFQIVDRKAFTFLTLVSVVFGILSGVVPWVFDNQFPPKEFLQWILALSILLTFVSLISSWSLLFRTIKLQKAPRMPLNTQIDDMFWDNDLVNIYYMLTKSCRKALDINRELIGEKGRLINLAYRDIALSAWLVAITTTLIIAAELTGSN